MRVRDLARLLATHCPEDAEIRIAACLEDPVTFGGSSHDLPLVGVTDQMAPAHMASIKTPDGPPTVWLVTSYLLTPQTPSRAKNRREPRDD